MPKRRFDEISKDIGGKVSKDVSDWKSEDDSSCDDEIANIFCDKVDLLAMYQRSDNEYRSPSDMTFEENDDLGLPRNDGFADFMSAFQDWQLKEDAVDVVHSEDGSHIFRFVCVSANGGVYEYFFNDSELAAEKWHNVTERVL